MDAINWLWQQVQWLMSLAQPSNLRELVNLGGPGWVSYAILFAIIFSETGLLVGFFLPGDSLLFAAGLLASQDVFNIFVLNLSLMTAAILGDAVNYAVGRKTGAIVFERGHGRFIKRDHLLAAKAFYEKHGGKAIVLARFVPLVRTFTPFVAGVAGMQYRTFVMFNVLGGIGWVASMTLAGYWLGRFEIIEKNFEKVVLIIVFLSILPLIIGVVKSRLAAKPAAEPGI